jgi:hypothetical protein
MFESGNIVLRKFLLALLFFCQIAPATASASQVKKRSEPILFSDDGRTAATETTVNIWMPQTKIESSYDLGRVPASQAGGLLDALIISSMDRNRRDILSLNLQEKADQQIQPIRNVLRDFDVDSIASTTTEKALSVPDWFKNKPTILAKNQTPDRRSNQTSQITYRYEMSPDFSSIRLYADIYFGPGVAPSKSKSATGSNPMFSHLITSIVQLRKRSFEPVENVAVWSAEDGKLAKEGLKAAFARMEDLIPIALKMTPAELATYKNKNREQGFAAGFNGPLLKRGGRAADDVLIWAKGLLQVHTLP